MQPAYRVIRGVPTRITAGRPVPPGRIVFAQLAAFTQELVVERAPSGSPKASVVHKGWKTDARGHEGRGFFLNLKRKHTGESCAIVAMIRHHLTIPGLLMAHIELPRALEDYFAFAETAPTRNGRRFVITLPYFSGGASAQKLDRLQWWFHLSPEQERQMGEAAIATLRAQAVEKFRRHIERWLQNTAQHLHGEEPIPRIDPLHAVADASSVGRSSK